MQSENKLFDDFVKMVNGFAGTFAGMGREAESGAREKFKEWMGGADFVGRDEFEAVKAMAAAGREEVGKGGVVRNPAVHERVCVEARAWVESRGWTVLGIIPSPITGPEGNVEFLLGAQKIGDS